MNNFEQIEKPKEELFYKRNDPNDVRLGEILPKEKYETADIVILGCPQDEGVRRNNGRIGAAEAPDKIREQFYKLTPFGIRKRVCDLGNIKIQETLEATHEVQTQIVSKILKDGKKIIVLGGGNDISYADGVAMSQNFGQEWIALNVDAHFDVRLAEQRNSGTPYRQLLDEQRLKPTYFYEIAYQSQLASPVYYRYLQKLGVNCVSLEQLRAKETAEVEVRDLIKQKFIHQSSSLSTFFGFDLDAVRANDAPGVSAPSPIGLTAEDFINLVRFAAGLVNTRMVEFTEVNPKYDTDCRTTKLVAIAMHRFCANVA